MPFGARLRDSLGIEIPIMQSGMAGVAVPELVSAVSNAGGLGVMASLRLKPDDVRASIRRVRDATDKPFGVNIWLHDDVRTSPDPESIPDDVVRASQSVLNEFRPQFDLPTTLERPTAQSDLVDAALEIMIEEQIPVFSAGLGIPEPQLVERFHAAGTKVVCMVATIDEGIAAVENGADAVIAQGSESGGHRSYGSKLPEQHEAIGMSSLVLVPEMVDAIGHRVPVIAAGGVVDGRGLAAMVALGADGVLMGTRFVATRESGASDLWKDRLTTGHRATTLTDGFTGQWARVLTTSFTDAWADTGVVPLPGLLQSAAGADLFEAAKATGDDQLQALYAGAGVTQLADIPSAGELVHDMAAEAQALLR